jgi:hypothetical protein
MYVAVMLKHTSVSIIYDLQNRPLSRASVCKFRDQCVAVVTLTAPTSA